MGDEKRILGASADGGTLRTIEEIDAKIAAIRIEQCQAQVSFDFFCNQRRRRIARLELDANALTALQMRKEPPDAK